MDKAKDEPVSTSTTADEEALNKVINQGIKFEEIPMPGASPSPASVASSAPSLPTIDTHTSGMAIPPKIEVKDDKEDKKEEAPTVKPLGDLISETSTPTSTPSPTPAPTQTESVPKISGALEDIKKSALEDLRPLVDKLGLTAEEKFDTLLLIIRSTDDQSMLQELHETSKKITDDAKRAQALLDVVKEVDYFSSKS